MIRVFTSKTQVLGEKGEDAAVSYLKKQGYSIIERNVPNTFGEIDIVAKKREKTYFFEVKAGREGSFINPAENLTKAKLRKLFVSAEHYALVHRLTDYRVAGIIVRIPYDPSRESRVEIIELF